MGLREAIAAADDIDMELVEVPEWGVKVELRALDVQSFTAIGRATRAGETSNLDLQLMYCQMLIKGVYDPDTGEPVFTDNDIDLLASKSMKVVERLTKRLNILSGMTDDADLAKSVDAEGKDSSGTAVP